MRCKRCGEPLEPMDTHCPVCGRAVAPRKKTVSQRNSETTIKLPQLEKFTHTYNQDASRIRTLLIATIAIAVVSVALMVLVYLGVGDMRQDVASMQDDMVNLQLMADSQLQQNQGQETPAPTDPTEAATEADIEPATEAEAIPLSKQDLTATLELYRTANGTYAAAELDLGTDPAAVETWVNTSREGSSRWTNVSWILTGSGDQLDLKLHDSYGASDAQVYAGLSWALSGSTFRSFADADCAWEYRVPGGQWTSVSDEFFADKAGSSELRLTVDQLNKLLGQYTSLELRCRLSLTHPDGGMLEITASGISMNAQGLITSGDKLG